MVLDNVGMVQPQVRLHLPLRVKHIRLIPQPLYILQVLLLYYFYSERIRFIILPLDFNHFSLHSLTEHYRILHVKVIVDMVVVVIYGRAIKIQLSKPNASPL